MRAHGITGHQLLGNLFGERGIEPALDVDRDQFLVLALVVCLQFRTFQLEVGRSMSACECTDTYSPAAIDTDPATRPPTAATTTLL
jgi:hypothetical protein